jgi:hypothetical protein
VGSSGGVAASSFSAENARNRQIVEGTAVRRVDEVERGSSDSWPKRASTLPGFLPVFEAIDLQRQEINAEGERAVVDAHDGRGIHERSGAVASERHARVAHERAPPTER